LETKSVREVEARAGLYRTFSSKSRNMASKDGKPLKRVQCDHIVPRHDGFGQWRATSLIEVSRSPCSRGDGLVLDVPHAPCEYHFHLLGVA
jgi:hypothetical protein